MASRPAASARAPIVSFTSSARPGPSRASGCRSSGRPSDWGCGRHAVSAGCADVAALPGERHGRVNEVAKRVRAVVRRGGVHVLRRASSRGRSGSVSISSGTARLSRGRACRDRRRVRRPSSPLTFTQPEMRSFVGLLRFRPQRRSCSSSVSFCSPRASSPTPVGRTFQRSHAAKTSSASICGGQFLPCVRSSARALWTSSRMIQERAGKHARRGHGGPDGAAGWPGARRSAPTFPSRGRRRWPSRGRLPARSARARGRREGSGDRPSSPQRTRRQCRSNCCATMPRTARGRRRRMR